jgi:hypothetical protein
MEQVTVCPRCSGLAKLRTVKITKAAPMPCLSCVACRIEVYGEANILAFQKAKSEVLT